MLRTIFSIAGRPGLYRLVSQGKNMLIVEGLSDKRRVPAYARDKVISLGDISIYTTGEDVALSTVLEAVKAKTGGEKVDVKALGGDGKIREFFGEVLPEFDDERVHTSDIKKLLQWYNILIDAGITEFVKEEKADEAAEEGSEKADEAAE